ncbi:DUF397 domain-containing protein [Embleya sp. NPDC008237]|uniref:DUF397 domain-containing protein n=1 Tax=Embleya sp. NPDC008237 TaxID=3363978 RepID=UPI0036E42721
MAEQTNRWRKSSYSASPQSECVECAPLDPHAVGVRDSKNPGGPHLHVHAGAWNAFLATTRGAPQ